MTKKVNNKRLSINKIAHIYNGRSRACVKCSFNLQNQYHYIGFRKEVLEDICKHCNKSFVEGFIKGAKYERKRI